MTEGSSTTGLISQVIEKLKLEIPDLAVEYFPDKPSNYRLNHPIGALLVQYARSKYESPDELDLIVQTRKAFVGVYIIQPMLYGRLGVVANVDRVSDALLGFAPMPWQRFILVEDTFVSEKDGLWTYIVIAETEGLKVEARDPLAGLPLATRITVDDEYDGIIVPRETL